jgi:CubicO group peptidase (beta-lactamase class C family)
MEMRLLLLLTVLCRCMAASGADPVKAGMSPERLARIPARMQAFVVRGTAAGFVTLVARRGQLASLAAVGYQDRESKTPMRVDTIFQIMSMSKPVTGVGIMILAEEGRLSLLDAVEKHLPEYRGQTMTNGAKPSHPITIRDLMTHTSGMPGGSPDALKGPRGNWDHTLAEVVAIESQMKLLSEPGVQWRYSNAGIATLGRIIEVVSGQPFEKFIHDRIFEPLGMKDTFYFLPVDRRSRLAAVYTDENGVLKRFTGDRFREGSKYPAPEGGIYSIATDLAAFYQMMLNHGVLGGKRILSRAAVDVMTALHTGDIPAGFAPGMGYGLTWSVVREPARTLRLNSIGAYGHGGAYRTYGWVDPAKDMLGVILFQRTNGGGDVADEINAFMVLAASAIED